MAKKVKYLDPQLLIDWGILQEINRRELHPRGLALAVTKDPETGKTTGIAGIQDYTDSKGGLTFRQELLSSQKHEDYNVLLEENAARRAEHLGYVIQPVVLPPKKAQAPVEKKPE